VGLRLRGVGVCLLVGIDHVKVQRPQDVTCIECRGGE
jgi:hypothetical protein